MHWNKFTNLNENDKIVYRNILGAFLVKGLALVVSLLTMPVYMGYFQDHEILGVWFTVLSVLTWVLNFDLGIGNGLRNKLTVALAQKDDGLAKEYIASCYWITGAVSLGIFAVGSLLLPFANWNAFFNISPRLIAAQDMLVVLRLVFFGMMLQFFLRLITSILYAMQKSALNNLIALVTNVALLLFALLAPHGTPVENLKMFAAAYVVCANLPLIAATVWVFAGTLRKCLPSFRFVRKEKARAVLSLGGLFFICQILYMVIANTNEFFITQYTSPANVVTYQIYNRLFTLASTLFMLALTPIWSAVSKSIAENDFIWLKKISHKITILSWVGIAVEFCMIPVLQLVLNIWLGAESIPVDYRVAAIFALYGSAMIYQTGVATIANGTGRMKIQAVCYTAGVAAKFLLVPVGVALTGSWAVIILVNALILIPYCVAQQIGLHRYLKRGGAENPAAAG